MAISGKNTMELIIAARDRTKGAFGKIGAQMRGTKISATGLNSSFKGLKGSMGNLTGAAGKLAGALGPLGIAGVAVAAGAAIGMFAASAVKAFTAFEDSMANVRKTTGMTKEETRALGNEIDTMALRLPVAHGELAKIAAVAGQLGIKGSENILGFTETIAKMSTAFDMSAEDVATAMAKLANIYDIPLEQIGNMGSAINVLGNTTAASESQLMAFAMSLGPTGQQLGFTYEQTMALGASMIEMGVNSSDAGTRLNRAFSKIGQNINELSKFMGVSSDEFKKSFQDMPMETFTSVLEKLSQVEGSLEANTIATELFGEVGAKSIKSLVGNLDGISVNLKSAETGFKENTSLAEEFAAKTDTLKAKFALVSNAAESFKINVGQALAPLAGTLAAGAAAGISGISKAFSAIQKVAGPVLDLLFIKFHALRAFLEGLFEPIMKALKPLSGIFGDTSGAVSSLNIVLNVMKDVFTIITGVARKLGTILGTLLAKAITPLVAKIKEGIATLTEFYNKLGPVKGLIEGIKNKAGAGVTAIGKWADSFKEAAPAAEELTEAVSDLTTEAEKLGPAFSESIKTLGSRLTEASGSYKTAIGDITKEINTLKDAWNLASDDQKRAIEKQINALVDIRDELSRGEEAANKNWNAHIKGTKEATEKQEEFTVKLGKTTVTFKGMAAEVVKNADAYAKLQKSAETLLDLDWSVFTELEAKLPNIDAGIGSMSTAFVGLKGILEDNIAELENVKQSVMDIADIAAPFLEKGFLNGIKAIGSFAGALSDAGGAINTFSSLQEVSVDGCIDFSLHVNDMVSALQILDNQMEDLVPSFAKMDSLITDISDAFLYSGDKTTKFVDNFDSAIEEAKGILDSGGESFSEFRAISDKAMEAGELTYMADFVKEGGVIFEDWKTITVNSVEDVRGAMSGWLGNTKNEFVTTVGTISSGTREVIKSYSDTTMNLHRWALETYGVSIAQDELYAILEAPPEEQAKWLDELMHREEALTFQMDKQTEALKDQTEQLSKITNALQPYLEFMETLNHLAELSTLSTEELNNGLDSINDTLIHLSEALSTFDLKPVMQSLFGDEESEGSAKKFIDTMETYSAKFDTLIFYVERLSSAITTLTGAFSALEDINKSVLADETALIELFSSITGIMENFTNAMDKSGFGDKLATGIEKMVSGAAPLTTYFAGNNAAVTQFNNTLITFKTTVGNVVSVMDRLQEMAAMTTPSVDELAAGFDKAAEFVQHFEEALLKHVGAQEGPWDMEKYFNSVFTSIKNLASSWEALTYDMDDSFDTFEDAISTITGLIGNITSLTKAFTDMKDIIIPDAIEMETALAKIPAVIKDLTAFLGKETWTDISANIAEFALKWKSVNEGISTSIDSFSHFVGTITKIISACTELTRIFTDMGEIVIIKSDEMAEALKDIPAVMAEVTAYLTTDSFKAIEDGLIDLNTGYKIHAKVLDDVMPSYDSAFSMFSKLASNVISLSKAFEELKDATIISAIDMDKAMQNIDVFINRFVESLRINMDNLVNSLVSLHIEWAKHADEMKVVMPSYETATKDIGTLISSITSLGSALLSLSEMGTISSKKFDTGFSALITSVANFATSLRNNVAPLIASLQLLRKAWIENEVVLVPLMVDFVTITKNFASLAYNANNMTKAFTELSENSGSLENGFDSLIGFIAKVVKSTKEFYTTETAASIKQYVLDIGLVIYAFRYLAEQLEKATGDVEREVKDAVENVSAKVLSLKSVIPDMYIYGSNSIIAFARGIHDYTWVLGGVLSNVADIIKKYLGVSSPTELGALKDVMVWPRNLVKSFASGIESEMGTLNNSFSEMALTAPTGGSGGSGNRTTISFHVTQNITDKATADYSTQELERLLSRHEML